MILSFKAVRNRYFGVFACCFLMCLSGVEAQITPPYYTSADIYNQIRKLNVLGSVLYVAAHPDDENNGFLPYLAKVKLYRTGYLSLTRGDGGQNLIGSEQGIELGMIRSEELLAARHIDGAEQYFSSAYEFGFSKNAAEALRIWDKEQVLSDMVWVIRKFQPDIIITRFPADARAGHGHHWASAILANEAFTAAADPGRFPEQLQRGVKVWQAKRILWNGFNFGGANNTSLPLKIDVGGFDPLLGKSSGELGGEARSMHKSQGEGRPRRRGEIIENFVTTGGDTAHNDLMEGIVTDWTRIDEGAGIQQRINSILAGYDFAHPEKSVNSLVELYKAIQRLSYRGVWWAKKLSELRNVIINCSGIFAEATTREEYVLQNDTARVSISINKRNPVPVTLRSVKVGFSNMSIGAQLDENRNYSYNISEEVREPSISRGTQPYWLREPQTLGNFLITDPTIVGNAWNDPLLEASFVFEIGGIEFSVSRPVQYKYIDPVKGEVYQPFVMIPHLSISMSPHVALLNVQNENGKLRRDSIKVIYKSNFAAATVPTTLYILQDTIKAVYTNQVKDFEKGKTYTETLPLKKYYAPNKGNDVEAAVVIWVNKKNYVNSQYFKTIAYDHIPTIHYSFKDRVHFVNEEVKTVGRKIGYINGAGDMVPEALMDMGYEVKTLEERDITEDNLKQYDAIIIGVRAHNIYEWLSDKNDILNEYVKNGGNLISQYVKSNNIGSQRIRIGPYPFSVSTGSRVTEENAEVHFLLPQHPVLNYPNKITQADFEGWIQERSTYQADQRDAAYEAPLGMSDTGEREGSGSLITAKYGKGRFTYVSLVLFRQLPAGVPGAYRLLANIIALSKAK
jgi:LmbE family N-acetylglucosaminyl deacetylase